MQKSAESELFDLRLAGECARAFSISTGLGCVVSDVAGSVRYEAGYGCATCGLCAAAGQPKKSCIQPHSHGMVEAERRGGKYLYFCPMGFACFDSPPLGGAGGEAKLTVGPFLMVDRQDFIDRELADHPGFLGHGLRAAVEILDRVPFVEPRRVPELSTLLFMAVGALNNVSAENLMLEISSSDDLHEQLSHYLGQPQQMETPPPYPFETERKFLQSIARSEKEEAQRLLNELLGAILFASGGDLERIKSRVSELLVLVSRTAVERGSDPEETLQLSHKHLHAIPRMSSIDELCYWLSGVIHHYMGSLFDFSEARYAVLIQKCMQYISANYEKKITLEQTAKLVGLSSPYLSRVFKQEMGITFNEYLNSVRIGKAKDLLRRTDLRLTDIALKVGYEDQSYFAKVFKRVAGSSPSHYRSGASA